MILTFVYSGLRLSELVQLNKDSIVTRKRTSPEGKVEFYGFAEVVGKGNKRRDILSSRGRRISDRAVQHVIDRWCKRFSLTRLHIHQLRHSFATRNVNAGMSLPVLQSLLGHANPNTTGRYFRIQSERKTREYFSVMEYISDTSPV